MSLTWTLVGSGWAGIVVEDDDGSAEMVASYITSAAGELLTAVTRLVLGENHAYAQCEAEPTAFRWIFQREGDSVWVQILRLADGSYPDSAGEEIWSSRQTIDSVARAVVRGFDEVAHVTGESVYHDKWGSPFPRAELEALRAAWKRRGP